MNVEIAPEMITATIEQGNPIDLNLSQTTLTASVQNTQPPSVGIDASPVTARIQTPAPVEADVSFAGGVTIGIGTPGGGGGSGFLAPPDLVDDTSTAELIMGWENVGGSWLVRRQTIGTADRVNATIAENFDTPDLVTAWADRGRLIYT